jgi:multicomponent Na+:H+ antiporter subunit A
MILAIIGVLVARTRLLALVCLGVVGLGVAILFALFGAPDLAITQLLVEALTVVLFALVIFRLPRFSTLSSRRTIVIDGIFAGLCGATVSLLVLKANLVQIAPSISDKLGEWSYLLAKGKNVVNVILVDFRALDTLGEITVLCIAALGVAALLRVRVNKEGRR